MLISRQGYVTCMRCRISQEAEAMKAKLTPEFLQLAFMQAVANNTKLYFGERLPAMLLDLHGILPAMRGQAAEP